MSSGHGTSMSLFTVMNGDTIYDSFFVSFGTTQTVENLRQKVRDFLSHYPNFKNNSLCNIAIDRFHLWKTVVPHPLILPSNMETFGRGIILLENLLTKRRLAMDERIADAFGGPGNALVGGMLFVEVKCED